MTLSITQRFVNKVYKALEYVQLQEVIGNSYGITYKSDDVGYNINRINSRLEKASTHDFLLIYGCYLSVAQLKNEVFK